MRKAACRAQHNLLKDRRSEVTSALQNTNTSTGPDRLGSTRLHTFKGACSCGGKQVGKGGIPCLVAPPLVGQLRPCVASPAPRGPTTSETGHRQPSAERQPVGASQTALLDQLLHPLRSGIMDERLLCSPRYLCLPVGLVLENKQESGCKIH